jgi:hypothetical protein
MILLLIYYIGHNPIQHTMCCPFSEQRWLLLYDCCPRIDGLQVSEEQLWSYMVQLATVLRVVHGAGLFFRPGGLHPSKVLVPSRGRLRVSAVGILDVLHGDPSDDPRVLQVRCYAAMILSGS